VTVAGTVAKIDWQNPHIYLYVDAKDDQGKVAQWKFEGYPPNMLVRQGWKRDTTMKVGDAITVTGWRARLDPHQGAAREVTFADGKKLMAGPRPAPGDSRSTGMLTRTLTSFIALAGAGRLGGRPCTGADRNAEAPPGAARRGRQAGSVRHLDRRRHRADLRRGRGRAHPAGRTRPPAGRRRRRASRPLQARGRQEAAGVPGAPRHRRSRWPRCLLTGVPRITVRPLPFEIVQLPNRVTHPVRDPPRVPDHPHRRAAASRRLEPSYLGDSVARWEGDTLVVDVTGFNDKTWLAASAPSTARKLRVTERYRRDTYDTIIYDVTMDDPEVFTKPWHQQETFRLRPGERIREYECIENNEDIVRWEKLLETEFKK
jgi:hypothetical protein